MNAKKISITIAFALIFILIVTTITLSLVKVTYKPDFEEPVVIAITDVSEDKSLYLNENVEDFEGQEIISNVTEKINDCFKRSILGVFFSGNARDNNSLTKTTTQPSWTGYKVTYIYDEEQTLTDGDITFKDSTNSNLDVVYTKIHFNITADFGYSTYTIYFEKVVGTTTYYYQYNTIAKTSELSTYLSGLTYQNIEV